MSSKCKGELHYENIAGVLGVFRMEGRKRIYRWRCPKCGHDGENNGKARYCSLPAPKPKPKRALSPEDRDDILNGLPMKIRELYNWMERSEPTVTAVRIKLVDLWPWLKEKS